MIFTLFKLRWSMFDLNFRLSMLQASLLHFERQNIPRQTRPTNVRFRILYQERHKISKGNESDLSGIHCGLYWLRSTNCPGYVGKQSHIAQITWESKPDFPDYLRKQAQIAQADRLGKQSQIVRIP